MLGECARYRWRVREKNGTRTNNEYNRNFDWRNGNDVKQKKWFIMCIVSWCGWAEANNAGDYHSPTHDKAMEDIIHRVLITQAKCTFCGHYAPNIPDFEHRPVLPVSFVTLIALFPRISISLRHHKIIIKFERNDKLWSWVSLWQCDIITLTFRLNVLLLLLVCLFCG